MKANYRWLVPFALVLIACGSDPAPQEPALDEISPWSLDDVRVIDVTATTATLQWTATGDDSTTGRASVYDLRYSLQPIRTTGAWAAATRFPLDIDPAPAGSLEQVTVTGLVPETSNYLAIVAIDDAGNSSERQQAVAITLIEVITSPLTPEDVLHNLRAAYILRDTDLHDSLFDPLRFVFVFDPIDVRENPDIPEMWGWVDERTAIRNMFESSLLDRVQVQFTVGTPRFVGDDVIDIDISEAHVILDTQDPTGGENIIMVVDGDRARFQMYRDANGWRISRWEDEKAGPLPTIEMSRGAMKTIYSPLVELRSWGGIKSLYHQ